MTVRAADVFASSRPRIARLFASVPPEVKTISFGPCIYQCGDLMAGFVYGGPCLLAEIMDARCVAEILGQIRHHRFEDLEDRPAWSHCYRDKLAATFKYCSTMLVTPSRLLALLLENFPNRRV